ncbi:MAG: hypothetical protein ACOC1O_01620 [bacterium]
MICPFCHKENKRTHYLFCNYKPKELNNKDAKFEYLKINFPDISNRDVLFFEYGRKYGYEFQHAENGGEYYIEHLGYFVDGYDIDNNVVIEYDEKYHFDINGNLKDKDKLRQKEIIEYLKCKFIRINYKDEIYYEES